MNSERVIDVKFDQYDMVWKKQNGGSVALFVYKGFTFNIDEILSVAVDNFFECVNFEKSLKKTKNNKRKIKK